VRILGAKSLRIHRLVRGDKAIGLNAGYLETAPASSPMIDTALRIGLVGVLVYACSRIVLPFAFILMWSAILAVMLYPLHLRLAKRLGDRGSALLIGLIGIAVILGPLVVMVTSLATSLYSLISNVQSQNATLPPPPLWLDGTPLVGQKLTEIWTLVATNLPAALTQYGHLMSGPLAWLASFAGGLAIAELSLVLSFAIAAVLVIYGKGAVEFARRLLERVTGSRARAVQLVTLTAATIRGVALGVIGVALIQSLLLGVGFFAIGLQAAGPLTLVALLLGIMQVPLILLTLPVVGYVFATEATQPAFIFLIWNVIVGLSDNILRPLMLGRGVEVPMPVILIGVIGGMIVDGLVGLFVGPVLLAVSYVLLLEWLRQNPVDDRRPNDEPTS
jgi:predicted PurR-regulated permease PerM